MYFAAAGLIYLRTASAEAPALSLYTTTSESESSYTRTKIYDVYFLFVLIALLDAAEICGNSLFSVKSTSV